MTVTISESTSSYLVEMGILISCACVLRLSGQVAEKVELSRWGRVVTWQLSRRHRFNEWSVFIHLHVNLTSLYHRIHIIDSAQMNQTADVSAGLAANPPAELQELLNDPRTTDSAREAVADVARLPVNSANGSTKQSSSQLGDGRLQVVNETQEFTCVLSLRPVAMTSLT